MKSIIITISVLVIAFFIFYPFLRSGVTFTQKNYLFKMKGAHKDYFTEDYSKADRHEIVDYNSNEKDPKIQDTLYAFLDTDLLKYCGNKIILGFKDGKIVSIGYPKRYWDWCGTNRPLVIPIFVENIESIRYHFTLIND